MLNSRIKFVHHNGGCVLISDEEGINDLEETPLSFLTRVDPGGFDMIDSYLCWGDFDRSFYSTHFPKYVSKFYSVGNCRSDLLNDLGRSYYKPEIASLKQIFGDFLLVSDNFSVDHIDPHYQPPRFNVSDSDWNARMLEWRWQTSIHSQRRDYLATILEQLTKQLSFRHHIIIRPHPVYSPLFWHKRFSCNTQVSTILRFNADPWIHASDGVLSSGCTLGLQALLANRCSMHLATPSDEPSKSITAKFSKSVLSPNDISMSLISTYDCSSSLNSYWNFTGSSTQRIADLIHKMSSNISPSTKTITLGPLPKLIPQPPKWLPLSLDEFNSKVSRWVSILSQNAPKVNYISPGVFLLSPY